MIFLFVCFIFRFEPSCKCQFFILNLHVNVNCDNSNSTNLAIISVTVLSFLKHILNEFTITSYYHDLLATRLLWSLKIKSQDIWRSSKIAKGSSGKIEKLRSGGVRSIVACAYGTRVLILFSTSKEIFLNYKIYVYYPILSVSYVWMVVLARDIDPQAFNVWDLIFF